MSIENMFIMAIIMTVLMVILLAVMIVKVVYHGAIILSSEDSELGVAFTSIQKTYSREEKDRFLDAVQNGDFKDGCPTDQYT